MLFVGCLVHFLQQMSGINMVLEYSVFFTIDKELNHMNWLFVMSAMRLFTTPLSLIFTIYFKRKPMFMVGFLICWLWNTLLFQIFNADEVSGEVNLTSYYNVLAVAIIAIYLLTFSLTFGSLTWIYSAEILTPKGMGIAVSVNWMTNVFIYFLPNIIWNFDPSLNREDWVDQDIGLFFFLFSGMCLLSFFWVLVLFREVKDIPRDSIYQLFDKTFYNKLLI